MGNSELMHAMHLVNDVKFRFRHNEGVFKSFIVAIDRYGKGLVDMNYLRHEVDGLFEDHPDLLEGFSIHALNPMIRKEEEEEEEEEEEKSAVVDRGHLLFRKISKVLGESALKEILFYCHCYTTEEIEKSELSLLAADVLRCHPGLLEEFDDFLDCPHGFLGGDLANKSPSKKKRKRSPSGDQEESDCLYDKPDFSKCQRVTPSYYEWPPKDQTPNLDEEEDCPLNNCLRIWPGNLTRSGHSSRGRTKSKEEKLRDDYEDKKYELDMLVASVASTTKAAEKLMIMNSENPIPVEEGLSGMNLRCIENLYGENGIEILGVLRENPRDALPVIVPRLQRKLEEVKEWARCFTFNKYSELNIKL